MSNLNGRLAKLEAGLRPARCPGHELRIRFTGDVGGSLAVSPLSACRRCGRPADEVVVEIECVPDREAPPP